MRRCGSKSGVGAGGFLAMLAVLATLLQGCGATKSSPPGKAKVTSGPTQNDRLRTSNDDLVIGRLQGDRFTLQSPHFKQLDLERGAIKKLEFDGDQDTVYTTGGDVLRGRLTVSKFTFAAKLGKTVEFKRADLKRIELSNP